MKEVIVFLITSIDGKSAVMLEDTKNILFDELNVFINEGSIGDTLKIEKLK